MKFVLGLGCDRGVSLQTLEDAIDGALRCCKLDKNGIIQLATIDKKNDEPALLQLAKKHRWKLQFFSAAQLAKIAVPSPSAVVLKYMNTPSVAEAAAILAAQADQQQLLLEKYKFLGQDQKNVTVSIVKYSPQLMPKNTHNNNTAQPK